MARPPSPDPGERAPRRLELTLAAENDLAEMFDRSAAGFGISARRRYEALVEAALADLQTEPIRLGSLDRAELGVGVRTYHLRNSRARAKTKDGVVRNPRHLIAYEFDQTRVLILRVLHDAMDLARHVQPPDPDDVSM